MWKKKWDLRCRTQFLPKKLMEQVDSHSAIASGTHDTKGSLSATPLDGVSVSLRPPLRLESILVCNS